jgi:hypothetical protein
VTQYRALFSMPIEANSDGAAIEAADEQAAAMCHPDRAIAGHVELVGEVREDAMEIIRVVSSDSWFLHQLHPDWKP